MNLPLKPAQFTGPAVLYALIFACQLIGFEHLAYDKELVEAGEWWRLLTGNGIHLNGVHVLLNGAGIVLLWLLHGDYYRPASYAIVVLCTGLAVGLGLLLLFPALGWYAGLSGVLHGLFAWGVGRDFLAGRRTAWLLALGLALKLAAEAWFGGDPYIGDLIGAPVATEAHLLGSVSGALVLALSLSISRLR